MKIIIYTDGGSRTDHRGDPILTSCAFVAYGDNATYLGARSNLIDPASNNVAEYHGVMLALSSLSEILATIDHSPVILEFRSDSELVVKQINGAYKAKKENLKALRDICRYGLEALGWRWNFVYVPREKNKAADYLCNLAMDGLCKKNLFSPMPPLDRRIRATAGQVDRSFGEVSSIRAMRADKDGFALCNGCGVRLNECACQGFYESTIQSHEDEEDDQAAA